MKYLFSIFFKLLILFSLYGTIVYANESIEITEKNSVLPITWTDLLPVDAFDFIPEGGVTDEMWSDQEFLLAVEKAGLATVSELNGINIRLTGFMVPLDVDFGEAEISIIGDGQFGELDVSLLASYTYSNPVILNPILDQD